MRFGLLPTACRVDEALHITVENVSPDARLVVRATSATPDGKVLASQATFAATRGDLDLARDAPLAGGYAGIDAMGLFWSRSVQDSAAAPPWLALDADPMAVTLSAEVEGTDERITHRLRRMYFDAAIVSRTELRENGLVGALFRPKREGRHPAVLVVGGSGGGLSWSGEMAALLAANGFAALALGYFGLEALPATLDRIPLETFGQALAWLRASPGVQPGGVAVCGSSRGGELALLLGATFPSISAVVAYSPSGIVGPAYPASGHSAWTLSGDELAYADVMPMEEWLSMVARGEAEEESFEWYLRPLRDPALLAASAIRVENIRGPVMLVLGAADRMWPSADLTAFALDRFRHGGFPHEVEVLAYPEAGHFLGWPHVSTTLTRFTHRVSGEEVDFGGTPEATAHARKDSWTRMLAFLRRSLPPRPDLTPA